VQDEEKEASVVKQTIPTCGTMGRDVQLPVARRQLTHREQCTLLAACVPSMPAVHIVAYDTVLLCRTDSEQLIRSCTKTRHM